MKKFLLSDLKYIPTRYVNIFKKENIITVEDLLLSYPTKFSDYTITHMSMVLPEKQVTIAGIVQSKAMVMSVKNNLSIMTFYADCDGRKIKVTIFNRQFLRSKITYGTYVRLTGKLKNDGKTFVAAEIHFDEFSDPINPVFNIPNISDDKVLEFKQKVFDDYENYIEDFIPNEIKDEYNLISLKRALKYINIPLDMDEVAMAIKRIKFEELFIYQLKIKYMLYMRKNNPEGIAINYDKELVQNFIEHLPYKLTIDQNKAINEILTDISSPYKMNRLLQGEVGSGKTVVAAIALFSVITKGYQGAIMVPTEILAKQHYETFTKLFSNINVKIDILSSSISLKDKQKKLDDLKNGVTNIIIGTHSLFQKDVIFYNLGLVVTDEEHRFGVKQRVSIVGKGYLIDHLKMSATPIPRTLAISILGDADLSQIKVLPGNKKEVITKYLKYKDKKQVFDHIKCELEKGHQIYIVCPAIEESESLELKNATTIYENMVKYYKGICNIGLVHSKLKASEKDEVMEKFSKNEIQILVSTSVIEVGVNIINATTIIILDAERFGVAQLHQMRGRVQRGDEQSYCFLLSSSETETAISRLQLLAGNSDGATLAEYDLKNRGPGDVFGERQTGSVPFKMADLVYDNDLLEIVNELADRLIDNKKLFNNKDYQELLDIVNNNYLLKKELLD